MPDYRDSGYGRGRGGCVYKLDFKLLEELLAEPVDKIIAIEADKGPAFITVESRYGYVDAWINNKYQVLSDSIIWAQNTRPSRPNPIDIKKRDAVVEEYKERVEVWLGDLIRQGRATI
jgi:hypothetical protein